MKWTIAILAFMAIAFTAPAQELETPPKGSMVCIEDIGPTSVPLPPTFTLNLGDLIKGIQVDYGPSMKRITHVFVVVDDIGTVVEAVGPLGVHNTETFASIIANRAIDGKYLVYEFSLFHYMGLDPQTVPYCTYMITKMIQDWMINSAIGKMMGHIGEPYDFGFALDNGASYCSELIWQAYLDGPGITLVQTQTVFSLNYVAPWTAIWAALGIPGEQLVIAPASLTTSPYFKLITDHNWTETVPAEDSCE